MALELVRDEAAECAKPADTVYYDEVARLLRRAAGTLDPDDVPRRPTLRLADAYSIRAIWVTP